MPSLIDKLRGIVGERRHTDKPVAEDRRSGKRSQRAQADQRLWDALDDLERTLGLREPKNGVKFVASNDRQQVVIFSTFRDICEFKLSQGIYRLCRHPAHEAANTGLAKCEEGLCPKLHVALKDIA